MSKRVGIEIGSCKTKIVVMKTSKNKKEVSDFRIIDTVEGVYTQGGDVQLSLMEGPIHDALKDMKVGQGQLYIAINHESVIVRTRSLPYSEESVTDNLIRFEAENFLPYDINEFNIDYKVLNVQEKKDDETDPAYDQEPAQEQANKKFVQNVMIVAAPKSLLNQYAELAKGLRLKLKVLTVYAEAIDKYLYASPSSKDNNCLYVDIGKSYINMIMYSKKEYFASLRSHYGIEYLLEQLMRDHDQDLEESIKDIFQRSRIDMDHMKSETILNGYQKLSDEINKMIDFFRSREYGAFVDEIHLLGGGANLKDFKDFLCENNHIKVMILEDDHLNKSVGDFCHSLIPAVGACIDK